MRAVHTDLHTDDAYMHACNLPLEEKTLCTYLPQLGRRDVEKWTLLLGFSCQIP